MLTSSQGRFRDLTLRKIPLQALDNRIDVGRRFNGARTLLPNYLGLHGRYLLLDLEDVGLVGLVAAQQSGALVL